MTEPELKKANINISRCGEPVCLELLPDDSLRVWAGVLPLGIIDEKKILVAYSEEQQLQPT